MRFGSVCSGIEAASVAWHELGWQAAWLAEVDVSASAVLAHRLGATAPQYPMEGTEKSLTRIDWGDRITNWGDMTRLPDAVRCGAAEAPDILCGGTPCFTAGHMVLTDSGYRPIEDLLPGDKVVTHEGRLRRVLRVGSKVSQVGRLKMVGLPDGITCTADHRFLSRQWKNQSTKRNGKYARIETVGEPEWTFASQMPGRQWLSRTKYEPESVVFPEGISPADVMLIAGLYLGDGWTRSWFGTAKKAVMFGLNPAKYAKFCDLLPEMHHCSFPERTVVKVQITNTKLATWLECHFGRLSHGKTIPSWVLSHPDRDLLLAGYRITDGSDDGNGKWTANTVSKSLGFGIASLAQTLNFTASVSLVKTSDTTSIEGRLVNQRDYWAVDAYPCDGSRKSRCFENHLLRTTSSWSDAGEAKVYDIEVEEDHSFILNGAIVHNCQGFSVAGLRGGLSDPRGQLTLSFVELANAIDDHRASRGQQPCVIFWENVPGVRSDSGNAFGHFLAGLVGMEDPIEPGPRPEPGRSSTHWTWKKETGEHVAKWPSAGVVAGPRRTVGWRSSDAQYFALAQRRERVFVVASAREGFDPQAVLLEFDGLRRDSVPSREMGEDVAGPFAPCLTGSHWDDDRNPHPSLNQSHNTGGVGQSNQELFSQRGAYLVPERSAELVGALDTECGFSKATMQSVYAGHQVPGIADAPAPTWWDGSPVSQTLDAVLHKGQTMPEKNRFPAVLQPVIPILEAGARTGNSTTDVRAGMGIGDVAFALGRNNGGENALYEPTMAVRRLMPVECERLQGFPDQWTLVPVGKGMAADGPRYKQLGNSWAVPCVTWIGKRLDRHLAELNGQIIDMEPVTVDALTIWMCAA